MKQYLSGNELFGDNFDFEQIKKWYEMESEGYALLGNQNKDSYEYHYNNLNIIHGFSKIKGDKFERVLGMGSAWGYEFEPILSNINSLTIIEPSDNLINNKIGEIKPDYVKPSILGDLPFDDNSFDLITCFGTLHHIPNVSFVISELRRVLKPNGFLLIREPIISMGDWRNLRKGLTKNERGIPAHIFDRIFRENDLEVHSKQYCFTATSFLQML
jgi:SAM-dependent methyltransferase